MSDTKKERIDYFMIWGHGLQYTDQILDIIRKDKDFEIISIIKKFIGDINKFVDDIYSCDTYPLQHLFSKTRYLLKTKPEILFILVRNTNPRERLAGSGKFRGLQCDTVVTVKKKIRNKFNPKVNGQPSRTDHVVHGSDYESQVEHTLKVLGLPPISFYTKEPNQDLEVPHHIKSFSKYSIKEVDIDHLFATILEVGVVHIEKTPHYKYVAGDKDVYRNYHKKHAGILLKDDHYPAAFDLMIANFKYDFITKKGKRSLILVKAVHDRYRILNGVHRAAILKYQGVKKVIVAVVGRDEE